MIDSDVPGNTLLDGDEKEGLLFPHVTTRAELDHLEQANIQDGLLWLKSHRHPDLLSEHFIFLLHKQLFGKVWSWAGNFRRTEKNIGVDPAQIAVQLRTLLDDVAYWIEHKTYQPLEIATRLHHKLVWIHLFPNGNGRHARIYADLLLTSVLEADPIDWSAGQDLLVSSQRRDQYLSALRAADAGNYSELFGFVGLQ